MIVSKLTNGLGNNLFQCIAGKMLATHHKTQHYFLPETQDYTCNPFLETLGFKKLKTEAVANPVFVDDISYPFAFESRFKDINIFLNGYFEDRRFYEPHRSLIKSWFEPVRKHNKQDLVFHFRTGDRLFYKNEFDSKPNAKQIKKAIDAFNFEKLYIVTDMYEWKKHTPESLSNLKFHVSANKDASVKIEQACDYFNECFEMLNDYNPIVNNGNVLEDFNLIRGFDKILFQHGTMSWWAAFLSDASKVGVYGPWRPWKGPSNKNLSQVELSSWFQWG
jgi:hypothetical protein